jgi:hypothetical protein
VERDKARLHFKSPLITANQNHFSQPIYILSDMTDTASAPYDMSAPIPALNGAPLDVEMKDEAAQEVNDLDINHFYFRH